MVFREFPNFKNLKNTLKILLDFIDKWKKEYRIKENWSIVKRLYSFIFYYL